MKTLSDIRQQSKTVQIIYKNQCLQLKGGTDGDQSAMDIEKAEIAIEKLEVVL